MKKILAVLLMLCTPAAAQNFLSDDGTFKPVTTGGITVGVSPIAGGTSLGVLYNNAGVLGNLATANNGVLITSGAGVPSISTTLPSGLTIPGYAKLAGGNTFVGQQIINSSGVSSVNSLEVYSDDLGVSPAGIGAFVYGGAGAGYGSGVIHGGGARGTRAAPTKMLSGDTYSGFGGLACGGGPPCQFPTSSSSSIHYRLTEDANLTTYNGSEMRLWGTPNGGGVRYNYATLTQDGVWYVNDTGTFNTLSTALTNPGSIKYKMTAAGSIGSNAMLAVTYANIGNGFHGRAASGGSSSSPGAAQSGQQLNTLLGYGWNSGTGAWSATSTAAIIMTATENYTANQGSQIAMGTTPTGSTARSDWFLLQEDASLGVGVGVAKTGAGTINVLNGVYANGTAPTGSGGYVRATSPSLVTPAIGVATATSLAVNGCTIGSNALCTTGTAAISSTLTSAAHTITSASANALAVGLNGATNPAFNIDASTASSATGLNIKSAAAAGGVALSALSSGTNESLTLDAKGSGTMTIGATSTGDIFLRRHVSVQYSAAANLTPDAEITINKNTAATTGTAFSGDMLLHLVSQNSTTNRLVMDTAQATNFITARTTGGTVESPSATLADQAILGFGATGYTNAMETGSYGFFRIHAKTLWSATNADTYIVMYTTPTGTKAVAEAVRVHSSGGVSVGTTSDPGIGLIYTNSASFMNRTKTSWTNGAAAAAGTLLNAPAAGNPTKWIPVDDNGTTRYIPAW